MKSVSNSDVSALLSAGIVLVIRAICIRMAQQEFLYGHLTYPELVPQKAIRNLADTGGAIFTSVCCNLHFLFALSSAQIPNAFGSSLSANFTNPVVPSPAALVGGGHARTQKAGAPTDPA